MKSSSLLELINQCASNISAEILLALCTIESSLNPYAIGIVDNRLSRQPETIQEAKEMANHLLENGYNYSLGLCQINIKNILKTPQGQDQFFNQCTNIKYADKIFYECYLRSKKTIKNISNDAHIDNAASCYYSGNFNRGFKIEKLGTSYVQRFNNQYLKTLLNKK